MTWLLKLCLLIAGLTASQDGAVASRAASDQETVVYLIIETAEQKKIDRVPVMLSVDGTHHFALTETNGVAKFNCGPLVAPCRGTIQFADMTLATWTDKEEALGRKRLAEVLDWYYFPGNNNPAGELYLDFVPNKREYEIKWTVVPTIAVRGTLSWGDQSSSTNMASAIARFSNGAFGRPDRNGVFEIHGIPSGMSNEIILHGYPLVYCLALDDEQTRKDFDLGTIRMQDVRSMPHGKLKLRLLHWQQQFKDKKGCPILAGITLFSGDGKMIVSLPYGSNGRAVMNDNNEWEAIPVGTYYVCAGWFTGLDDQIALRDAIRNGILESELYIPTLTILEGQVSTVEFEAAELVDALVKAGGIKRPATSNEPEIATSRPDHTVEHEPQSRSCLMDQEV